MKRKIILVIIAMLLACTSFFAIAIMASAGTINGTVNMTLDCTAIHFSGGGTVTFDRDTNGNNTETINLEARNGAGTIIFSGTQTSTLGTTVPFASNYPYTTAPSFNPITARLFSPAGNGLPEQVILSANGVCAGLPYASPIPTMTEWGMIILVILLVIGSIYYLRGRVVA